MFKWLLIQRSENIPINGTMSMLKEKTLGFAKQLNIEKLQVSDSWLHAWKT